MRSALVNGRIAAEGGLADGLALLLEGDRIAAIVPDNAVPGDIARTDLQGGILAPGFIDIQVNGGGGVLFNDAPTVETIAAIGAAHARFGTAGFLPALISAEPQMIAAAVAAVDDAMAAGVPGVLGIHIEGPFLSTVRKGIHNAAKFRVLDREAIALLSSLKRGKTVVTLAPETTTPEMIRALADTGVLVCAGHTDASFEVMQTALRSGVRGVTHLFNAMSQLVSRAPGTVGAALDDPESWCGLIVDGYHVHPGSLRAALRCKGASKLMLVTDAMPSVGSAGESFLLEGRRITVRNGMCAAEDGTLAGSDLDMASAVRNAVTMMQVDLASAFRMASRSPAEFLGLQDTHGRIAPGYRADLVLLDEALGVQRSWIAGQSVFTACVVAS